MENIVRSCFAISILICSSLYGKEEKLDDHLQEVKKINEILFLIKDHYYRDVPISELSKGAVRGMLQVLDNHSTYLPKKIYNSLVRDDESTLKKLGILLVSKNETVVIHQIRKKSFAYAAGLREGDTIVRINNHKVDSDHSSMIDLYIRGANKFKISVKRNKKIIDIHISLKQDINNKLSFFKLDDDILICQIKEFYSGLVKDFFNELIDKKSTSLKGIVLDLRGNPGGLLEEAVDLVSVFIDHGVVVKIEGRKNKMNHIRYTTNKFKSKLMHIPLAVLVNKKSASASEIFAAAIKDYRRGPILGETTYGKGTIQSIFDLNNGDAFKLTMAQYVSPLGFEIDGSGVAPTIPMNLDNFNILTFPWNKYIFKKKD